MWIDVDPKLNFEKYSFLALFINECYNSWSQLISPPDQKIVSSVKGDDDFVKDLLLLSFKGAHHSLHFSRKTLWHEMKRLRK